MVWGAGWRMWAYLAMDDNDVVVVCGEKGLSVVAEIDEEREGERVVVFKLVLCGLGAREKGVGSILVFVLGTEVVHLVGPARVFGLEELFHLAHRVAVHRLEPRRREPHGNDLVGDIRQIKVIPVLLVPDLVL